jgi:hypothetical protein
MLTEAVTELGTSDWIQVAAMVWLFYKLDFSIAACPLY